MKHFSLLTLLLLFMGMYVFSQEITVEVPTLSAPAIGQTIDVPVILSGAGESGVPISACDINIAFDQSVLTYSGLVNFSPLAVSNEWVFNGTGGTVYANWIEPTVTTTVAFPDATVLFYVRFTYTGGSSTLIYTKNEFYDVNYNLVPTNTINGAVNGVALTKTLNLTNVRLEHLFVTGTGGMMNQAYNAIGPEYTAPTADVITVELHDAATYATILRTYPGVLLSQSGTASVSGIDLPDGNYRITIKHRNSIETTSTVVDFTGATVAYSFGTAASAFGNNLKLIDGFYCIFGGDVNQDGQVEGLDITPIDVGVATFVKGYVVIDVDGDGQLTTGDFTIWENNNNSFVTRKIPTP